MQDTWGWVRLLLERQEVDPNLYDDEDDTPLWWAAFHGHTAVVQLLLCWQDIDLNRKSNYGDAPLAAAARRGHEEVIRLFIQRDDVETNFNTVLCGWQRFMGARGSGTSLGKIRCQAG
jgi:ankyrin repeat protein